MTVSPEELAAFADGELPPERAEQVAAEVAADPHLARQVESHRALRGLLSSHYDPIAAKPVPDRLAAMLAAGTVQVAASPAVADLGAARARRAARRLPRWSWYAGPALAASLALLLVVTPSNQSAGSYAGAQLAAVLDSRLSADPVSGGERQVLLSFARESGEICRAWVGPEDSGIACRDDTGWRVVRQGEGVALGQGGYRQANSSVGNLMAAAQDMAQAGALGPEQEAAAREQGWR